MHTYIIAGALMGARGEAWWSGVASTALRLRLYHSYHDYTAQVTLLMAPELLCVVYV